MESKSGLSLRTRLDMNDRRHKGYATRRMQVLEWRMGARCKGAVVVSAALNMMHETRNVWLTTVSPQPSNLNHIYTSTTWLPFVPDKSHTFPRLTGRKSLCWTGSDGLDWLRSDSSLYCIASLINRRLRVGYCTTASAWCRPSAEKFRLREICPVTYSLCKDYQRLALEQVYKPTREGKLIQ